MSAVDLIPPSSLALAPAISLAPVPKPATITPTVYIDNFLLEATLPSFRDLKALMEVDCSPEELDKLWRLKAESEELGGCFLLAELGLIYQRQDIGELIRFISENHLTAGMIETIYPVDDSGKLTRVYRSFFSSKIDILEKMKGSKIEEAELEGLFESITETFPYPKKQVFLKLIQHVTAIKTQIISRAIVLKQAPLALEEAPKIGTFTEVTKRMGEDLPEILAHLDANSAHYELMASQITTILAEASPKALETLLNELDRKELFLAAFDGFKKGTVNFEILTRLSELLAVEDKPISVLDPLNSDGSFNKEACEILKKGLDHYLTPDDQIRFFDNLKSLPKESRLVFLYDTEEKFLPFDTIVKSGLNQYLFPINEILVNKQGFNLLNMIPHESGAKRMLVSNSLVQQAYMIQFPESFVTMNPVFGISSPSQIRKNGLTDTRDLCLHYVTIDERGEKQVKQFPSADHYPCKENDFESHDRYHAWVCSAIPKEYKKLSIEIADFISRLAVENRAKIGEVNYRALRKLSWQFKDMDYLGFVIPKMRRTDPDHPLFKAPAGSTETARPAHWEFLQSMANIFSSYINNAVVANNVTILSSLPREKLFGSSLEILDKKDLLLDSMEPLEKPGAIFDLYDLIMEEFAAKIPESAKFNKTLREYMVATVADVTIPIITVGRRTLATKLHALTFESRILLSEQLKFAEKLFDVAQHFEV